MRTPARRATSATSSSPAVTSSPQPARSSLSRDAAAGVDRILDDQRVSRNPGKHHLNQLVDVLHDAINVTSPPSVSAECETEPNVLPSPARHLDAVSR